MDDLTKSIIKSGKLLNLKDIYIALAWDEDNAPTIKLVPASERDNHSGYDAESWGSPLRLFLYIICLYAGQKTNLRKLRSIIKELAKIEEFSEAVSYDALYWAHPPPLKSRAST